MKLLLLNDKNIYNQRYRHSIINKLGSSGFNIETIGLFDSFLTFCKIFYRFLVFSDWLIISSNMKCNLFTLAFARSPKIIIVNGFGRYRRNYLIRNAIKCLLSMRKDVFALVQNYADYRYLRRNCSKLKIEWIPGSGGRNKKVGDSGALVLIQRDNKISLVAPDVLNLVSNFKNNVKLVVVGCEDTTQLERLFGANGVHSAGYLSTSDILSVGSIFLQPSGYGEGFPHTLADAIVSKMEIYISNREFIRYGLRKLGARRESIVPGWSRLITTREVISAVHEQTITARIYGICSDYAKRHIP